MVLKNRKRKIIYCDYQIAFNFQCLFICKEIKLMANEVLIPPHQNDMDNYRKAKMQ